MASPRRPGTPEQQTSAAAGGGVSVTRRKQGDGTVAVVKKYANRRLYNTATSSYVTLDELSKMVRLGEQFVVYDAKSGEDLTRSVLTQIILEEDSKGRNLLPISFLRQLISFYDDNLRAFLPRYLELSMENFMRNQEQIRRYIEGTFGTFFPVGHFEDMARQNMALFQRAATIFNPVTGEESQAADEAVGSPAAGEGPPAAAATPDAATSRQIDELNQKIDALEKQIGDLVAGRGEGR
jgi:polyhydroxyalkanoate synthesis repressor PhaR